jgi:hypothetical protein
VDAHVEDEAAAAPGIGVLDRRPVWIAGGRLEHHRVADDAFLEALLGGGEAAIEPAHEPHLEEHA